MENLSITTLRKEELFVLKSHVDRGIPVCLQGISGLGKTQLLRDLATIYLDKNPNKTVININISDTGVTSVGGVLKLLLRRLGKVEQEPVFSDGFVDENLEYDKLKHFLIEEYKLGKQNRLLLILDDIDYLNEIHQTNLAKLLTLLKKEFNGGFSIVASCQRTISAFDSLFSTNRVTLKPLSSQDYDSFTAVLLSQSPFALTQSQLVDLYRITGGHPRYTYAIISAATSSLAGLNWSKFIDTVFLKPEIRIISENIWKSLSPSERNILKSWPKVDIRDKNQYQSIVDLEKIGLFKRIDGNYSIFSSAFESFLKIGCLKDKRRLGIDINPNTERVTRDGETLSIKLSPAESVILKYLIKRRNQIVLRKDIIDELSSINSCEISDTALDQMVSRLRSKIEIERNNPKYFHTVRGKGFQLVDN